MFDIVVYLLVSASYGQLAHEANRRRHPCLGYFSLSLLYAVLAGKKGILG
ncbi:MULTISPECIES: hypothetical protein [Roseomonadaceae]|uniref:Uncharacterized protein n=1 Tax=Falsiroseomonas oleicola TaxID=2801474 RepID=A0ABS6H897_9PROT|nr:hypothetical protein [Roseomonas oleicola]MBU8544923.1 hypothetical protein [Roseomonas oleicola]